MQHGAVSDPISLDNVRVIYALSRISYFSTFDDGGMHAISFGLSNSESAVVLAVIGLCAVLLPEGVGLWTTRLAER